MCVMSVYKYKNVYVYIYILRASVCLYIYTLMCIYIKEIRTALFLHSS